MAQFFKLQFTIEESVSSDFDNPKKVVSWEQTITDETSYDAGVSVLAAGGSADTIFSTFDDQDLVAVMVQTTAAMNLTIRIDGDIEVIMMDPTIPYLLPRDGAVDKDFFTIGEDSLGSNPDHRVKYWTIGS